MSTQFEPILTRNIGVPNSETIAVYLKRGGYTALKKALTQTPDDVIAEVRESGLLYAQGRRDQVRVHQHRRG
jgi:NADH:ubiquinone oxidoreductase subunit F (NADH-binding)